MHLEDRGRDRAGEQRWRAVAYFGSDDRGRPVRRSWSFTEPSKRAAERAANAWEAQQRATLTRRGRRSDMASMDALAEWWWGHLERSDRSPSTLDNYRQKWASHLRGPIGRLRPRELSPADLNDVYATMRRTKRSPATIRQVHNIVAGMLREAEKQGWVDRNVARLATPPSVSPPALALPDVAQVRAVIDRIPAGVTRDVVRVLAATGARRGEVLALTWADVDFSARTLRIDEAVITRPRGGRHVKETKTKTVRTVAVDDATLSLFAALRARSADVEPDWPVFAWSPGEPCVAPHTISQAWRRAAREVGLTMPLKQLRHLHATLLLDAGLSVAAVAARTGHADGGRILLARYAAGTQGADRSAADIIAGKLGP